MKEVGYALVKAGIGSIPAAGGVLSELFSVAFSDPASKRREQVLLEMDARLKKLEEEGYDIQKLGGNEEFLTITLHAYNIAMRTHQAEKRLALMNAISNTPKLSIDENIKLMYLAYIDEFNEWHLRILSFLSDPAKYFGENRPNYHMAGKATILTQAFPELADKRAFYDQIVSDLRSRSLIVYDSLHVTMSEQGLWQSGTSEFGKQFLNYISER